MQKKWSLRSNSSSMVVDHFQDVYEQINHLLVGFESKEVKNHRRVTYKWITYLLSSLKYLIMYTSTCIKYFSCVQKL